MKSPKKPQQPKLSPLTVNSPVKKLSHGNAHRNGNGNSTYSETEELVHVEPIPDTPFAGLKYDGKWYLTLGKYRLTQELKDYKACVTASKDASWQRIMQVIQIMIDYNNENQKTSTQISKETGTQQETHTKNNADN